MGSNAELSSTLGQEVHTLLPNINLLTLDIPKYESLIAKHLHLKGVTLIEIWSHSCPCTWCLGGSECMRIKTERRPHFGQDGEPIAELTKLGWFIMSPGQEFNRNRMMLTQTSQLDYEELSRLDVLSLVDPPEHNQKTVQGQFREQLLRSE